MSDFHRASPKMIRLRLCRIANNSTETENCYQSLNRELRWLWNSVYMNIKSHTFLFSIYPYNSVQIVFISSNFIWKKISIA